MTSCLKASMASHLVRSQNDSSSKNSGGTYHFKTSCLRSAVPMPSSRWPPTMLVTRLWQRSIKPGCSMAVYCNVVPGCPSARVVSGRLLSASLTLTLSPPPSCSKCSQFCPYHFACSCRDAEECIVCFRTPNVTLLILRSNREVQGVTEGSCRCCMSNICVLTGRWLTNGLFDETETHFKAFTLIKGTLPFHSAICCLFFHFHNSS